LTSHEGYERLDAFISHASEDKNEVARPLALELRKHSLKIWYDEFSLHIGDSLSASIDKGLSISDYGVVILSKNFFAKDWPPQELSALITKQVNLHKRIILPIWHNISKEEIQNYSPILADTVAAKSSDGIENIAIKLYRVIKNKELRPVYNFSSDIKLKEDLSSLFKSLDERELLLKAAEEESELVILTKIYLISKGYRNIFIFFWPFSELLSSSNRERERVEKIINALIERNFVSSKALGTISITHSGIKKIETLLEDSYNKDSTLLSASQFLPLINEAEKFEILEIQKLRYNILKLTYDMSTQKKSIVNLFKIGEPLRIDKEKLERIYFFLEDEGLIDFYALGGCFFITDKGKELIEKRSSNRIF
jgi:predicted transcriptional regulator